jgi:non-canonical (house-cleaning) NTP pyrophosphatase
MGAIGYLSKGKINREEFNAQAVLMAMIPRISGELYF